MIIIPIIIMILLSSFSSKFNKVYHIEFAEQTYTPTKHKQTITF